MLKNNPTINAQDQELKNEWRGQVTENEFEQAITGIPENTKKALKEFMKNNNLYK